MTDALGNYRIVDFGWVLAGAIPGMILSDMGAEVIKVESRRRLDYMRQGRPLMGDKPDPEQNPMFHNVCRNKLSITLDISQPKATSLIKKLVKTSDAVVENFAPGVLEKLGLDYESLRAVKPDIILVSISGAGRNGPLSDLRAYAHTITAISGMDSMVGYPGGRPLGIKHPYGDICASLYAAVSLLAALHYRDTTGEGQHIDVSMQEATTATLGEATMDYVMNKRVAEPLGNYDPTMAPHNNYPCKGEDEWVSIAVDTEEEWRNLCRAMGNPAWTREERFSDKLNRLSNVDELDRRINHWTINYTPYEVTNILQAVGVAAFPLLGAEGRFTDPHFKEREVYVDVEHPAVGSEAIYNVSWKMSETPGGVRRHAPLLGEHNEYVLGQLLGLSQQEINQLTDEGVIY